MIVRVNIVLKRTVYTLNCSNIVLKNEKKEKSQIGINEYNQATFSGWIHLQSSHFSAGMLFFLLFFSYKTIANSNRQIRRLCADAANEFIRLISLTNSYLAFSFFLFSMTTFLQIGVYIYNLIDQSSPSCSTGG